MMNKFKQAINILPIINNAFVARISSSERASSFSVNKNRNTVK